MQGAGQEHSTACYFAFFFSSKNSTVSVLYDSQLQEINRKTKLAKGIILQSIAVIPISGALFIWGCFYGGLNVSINNFNSKNLNIVSDMLGTFYPFKNVST